MAENCPNGEPSTDIKGICPLNDYSFFPEMTEMGMSHGKGTSYFVALPPREWGQHLVKHACLSTGQRALPWHVFSQCFLWPT